MRELVFLLEEASAKAMLESLLPRLLYTKIGFRCISFEGKQDLEKQLSRKIKAYRNTLARFIVLRDQDQHHDCISLKARLQDLCTSTGKAACCSVCIACHELESFYLADLQAVEDALEIKGLALQQRNALFRQPDRLGNPSQELFKLTKYAYQKVAGSRAIGQHLRLDNTRSTSFQHLIQAIQQFETELIHTTA